MPSRNRRPSRARLLALALACALFALAGVATQIAQAAPVKYVALGDSYSAASGVLPPDPAAFPLCARSILKLPARDLVEDRGSLTDVTCGAAETRHFFTSQYPGVPPQLDAVKPDTQVVTMTIGGNDSNVFIGAIVACGSAGLSTLGFGTPCKNLYGSYFENTIRNSTYPSLVNALQAVRAKAPGAKVAILGYPWIMPPTRGCFLKMPVAPGDVPYVRGIQATLNDAVKRAAAATGATYVDFSTVSEGHDACQAAGVRWIEPVLGGSNPVIVHPNALGESQMATQTIAVLGQG